MRKETVVFSQKEATFLYGAPFSSITSFFPLEKIVIITDENVFAHHHDAFEALTCIRIPGGEAHKQQGTVDDIIKKLIAIEADKQTVLVGVGGGVVTDITGYVASIYKRGIQLALVPTTILSLVDAAIGGKNGIDCGPYKNMVGTVYQPELILFDYQFLNSLPEVEWINGFAEIIKHACIKSKPMFDVLVQHDIKYFMQNRESLVNLIEQNINIKKQIVLADEYEQGDRKLLNFGHTFGHAIENIYDLKHGHAVSVGMMLAAKLSEKITGLSPADAAALRKMLLAYRLPVEHEMDKTKVWELMKLDKKRKSNTMSFILLDEIGTASIHPIAMDLLKTYLDEIA